MDDVTYILPIRGSRPSTTELTEYLRRLALMVREIIVVDGSPEEIFAANGAAWGTLVRHVPPDRAFATPMGKVGNVMTGIGLASFERVIIADDDVRYDRDALSRLAATLEKVDVARPQNYFDPLPWHARWDTGRMLLNRMTGGDWPGTLAVRRSILRATGGYDGNAMFENLELVRTVVAAGGQAASFLSIYVLRRPSTVRHFWSQRVRQAYDEMARPWRLLVQLATLPLTVVLALGGHWLALLAISGAVAAVAELGRRRDKGARVFPVSASFFAPLWLAERAICSWLAVFSRLFLGGVRYRGKVLKLAANPQRVLRARHKLARERDIRPHPDHTPRYRSA
ncbi:MAG TPA: glycosyltransferase family 2 protein [Gemmatimonadaceae bacterium]|nr:glycosyltransferase family 2 protein [Gemmatimonadaceae bacterium]